MCLHVFVGSLLLTETGRLFPSLMVVIGGWLSAFMPTTKRRSWKENYQMSGTVKPTFLHNRIQTEIFVLVVP